MSIDYQKVWRTMNDLEQVIAKVISAREMIDIANECCGMNQQERAETMTMAAYEFLGYFIEEFDDKFKLAWQATVGDLRDGDVDNCMPPWDHSDVEVLKYSDNELEAMCDKAELDAQVERVRKEGGYDWTPEQQIEYTNAKIEVNSPYNDGWTKEHYQKIVDKYENETQSLVCDGDDPSEECKNSWNDFWEEDGVSITGNPTASPDMLVLGNKNKENNVEKRWVLPVEVDAASGEYYIMFPDDLLEAASLKEGDQVEWYDNKDGSCLFKKCNKPLTYDEMIAEGWSMTADGFWIKE